MFRDPESMVSSVFRGFISSRRLALFGLDEGGFFFAPDHFGVDVAFGELLGLLGQG